MNDNKQIIFNPRHKKCPDYFDVYNEKSLLYEMECPSCKRKKVSSTYEWSQCQCGDVIN